MQKIIVSLLTIMLCLMSMGSFAAAADNGLTVERNTITVSLAGTVQENVIMKNNGFENITVIRFWVQQPIKGSIEIVSVSTGTLLPTTVSGNMHTCNLSVINMEILPGDSLTVRLTYTLTSVENFDKTLVYSTGFLSVDFDSKNLFEGKDLNPGVGLSFLLYNPTNSPLGIIWIVGIVLLVVVIILLGLLLLRRQRSKAKASIVETEEILGTKKALLLSLLKDLEKQHRAQEISDDTYQKLKDEYKQQAVLAMKKADDLKK